MGKGPKEIDVPDGFEAIDNDAPAGFEPVSSDLPDGYEPVTNKQEIRRPTPGERLIPQIEQNRNKVEDGVKILQKIGRLFQSPPERKAKAANTLVMSEKSGIPPGAIEADYKRQALRYLRPPESFTPEDKLRAALDQGFALGLIGTQPIYPEFQEEHPVLDAIGQGAGGLAGLVGTGAVLEGAGIGKTVYGELFKKYGIKGMPLAATMARATSAGATFGAKTAAGELLQMANDERITLDSARAVLEDTAFGLGLGTVGSIAKPALRIPSEMFYGYTTAKLQGADDLNALINAGVFGIFGILNRADYSKEYKIAAINEVVDTMTKKAQEFGLPPDVAAQQARSFVYDNLMMSTLESDPAKAWEKIFTSREYNLRYFDTLNENLKTLRRVQHIPEAAAEASPAGSAVASGAPQPPNTTTTGVTSNAKENVIYERKSTDERRLVRKINGQWTTQWYVPGDEAGLSWVSVADEDIPQLEKDIANGVWKEQSKRSEQKIPTQEEADNNHISRLIEKAVTSESPEIEKIKKRKELARKKAADRIIKDGKITTQSGRVITAPSPIRTESSRKTAKDLLALDKWLLAQAQAEAQYRKDDYTQTLFKGLKGDKLTPADKDILNEYLFGETDPVFYKEPGESKTSPKEPWQMSQKEYRNSLRIGSGNITLTRVKEIHAEHKASVQQALSEGKPVPEEVLKDYPEIIKEAQQVSKKKIKKAKIIKKALSLLPDDKVAANILRGEIDDGEAGYRYVTKDEITGGVARSASVPSTFPEYFQNKGYTKKGTLGIIDKVLKGEPITEKQASVFNDLLDGIKQQIKKEIAYYDDQIKKLAAEFGYSREETAKISESYKAIIESEEDSENFGSVISSEKSFPDSDAAYNFIDDVERRGGVANITRVTEKETFVSYSLPFESEAVPGVGKQTMIPGTKERSMPPSPLQAKTDQAEEKLTELKNGLSPETQKDMFGPAAGGQPTAGGKGVALDSKALEGYTVSESEAAYGSKEQAEESKQSVLSTILALRRSKIGVSDKQGQESPTARRSRIAEELQRRSFVDFRGISVRDAHDVAEIAATFRHPKVENFQAIFLKNNTVVAHQVLTSGAVDYAWFTHKTMYRFVDAAKRLGADTIYLAHNHPSGNPAPSKEDASLTKYIYRLFNDNNIKLGGHITTDDIEYHLIDVKDGAFRSTLHGFNEPLMNYKEGIEKQASSPKVAASAAKDFITPGKISVMFLDARNSVLSIDNVNSEADIYQYAKEGLPRYGAVRYIVVAPERQKITTKRFSPGLLDVITVGYPDGKIEIRSWKEGDIRVKDPGEDAELKGAYHIQEDRLDYGSQKSKRTDSWGVEMSMSPESKKTINKTEIVAWAERNFNVPIRGKATHIMAKWAGVYHTKAELIRMKKWGDLWPMTHELAHHIDKKMKQSLGRYWRKGATPESKRAIVKELCDLDYDQSKRRTSEGFAEFMRYYLTTNQAESKAPEFYKFFTQGFLLANKDLAAKLKTLRGMLDTWKQQGAENRIIEQIDFTQEHTKPGDFGQKVKAGIEKAWAWINKNFNDEFYTIEDIEKQMGIKRRENIRPTQDPYEMATYYKSKAGVIARTFVMEKAIDEYGRVLGPGLSEILKPIKSEDMQRFIAYGSAKRALELSKRNIDSGFDLDDAKYIVDKYKNEVWDKAVDDITVWANHLLDWVIRAGGLGQEEAEIIRKMNPIYLPFKRAFVDELGVVKGVGTGLVNKGQAVKKIKGSGRPIINPLESLVAQANAMILKAQKINIARLIADQASKEGVGGFITKVPAPIEARTYTLEQLKSGLDAMGVDIGDADLDQVMTVFTQGWQYRGKDNIVSIWRNGQREFYEIHPELYRALCGLENLQRGVLLKILGPFSRILRLGATGIKVSFGLIRNPWRDALSYAVLSKHKTAIPVVDTVTGVVKELTAKPGDLAWRFKNAGGSMSGMMGYDRAATMKIYEDLVNEKLRASKKVIKTVQNPIGALLFAIDKFRGGLNISELGPRIAELEKSYKEYQKTHPDWNEEDCFVAAFNDAQDVTINFTKSGYLGKRINEGIAFFNANLRGFEKTYRSIKENPVRFFIKGLAWLTVFTVLNWFRNKDKEWYKNLPPAFRYSNVFIQVDDQTIIRLPIPFEVGTIFMSAPAAALDSLEAQDPKYIQALGELITKQKPNIMPSALQPIWEVGTNKNYYGSDIEDKGMQYLPKIDRTRSNTSKIAVGIVQALHGLGIQALSPVQIEHLMQQYTGGAIKQIPQGKVQELSDVPVMSDILVNMPAKPKRQLSEFYNEWEDLNYKRQTRSMKKGDLSRFVRLKSVHNYIKLYQKQARQLDDAGKIKARDYVFMKMGNILEKAGY